jgi:secreted PhoX family phosphatase
MKTSIENIIDKKITKRGFLKNGFKISGAALAGWFLNSTSAIDAFAAQSSITPVKDSFEKELSIAPDYRYQYLIGWGDEFKNKSSSTAEKFGYNNDFTAFMPLPRGSKSSENGILFVNHEYPNIELMSDNKTPLETRIKLSMEAMGLSLVEITKDDSWKVNRDSVYNRRIKIFHDFKISGDAAGSKRLISKANPTGLVAKGTIANCAGGKTPWGTVLTCEENFDDYFGNLAENTSEYTNHREYGIKPKPSKHKFELVDERFDVSKHPNEPNNFGWVCEVNPYEANATPVKRTSLGRFKHEGATCVLSSDNKVVVYMGDDERFQYIYKFVSDEAYNAEKPNPNILDKGTLYVAKFYEDGTLNWMPLSFGNSGINEDNGFNSQADVMINTRRAAKILGATDMDRPEDIDVNPVTGKVYVACTNNFKRLDTNPANPRIANIHGHIIEFTPPKVGDKVNHAAETFDWDIFILGGGSFACPDNIAFNLNGEMFITTDGMSKINDTSDGIFKIDGKNAYRIINAPIGSEPTGPEITPNGKSLFLSIQHPAEGSVLDAISTRWPDFNSMIPPRPSVITITKKDGGVV